MAGRIAPRLIPRPCRAGAVAVPWWGQPVPSAGWGPVDGPKISWSPCPLNAHSCPLNDHSWVIMSPHVPSAPVDQSCPCVARPPPVSRLPPSAFCLPKQLDPRAVGLIVMTPQPPARPARDRARPPPAQGSPGRESRPRPAVRRSGTAEAGSTGTSPSRRDSDRQTCSRASK
jgi:hypothetical protein